MASAVGEVPLPYTPWVGGEFRWRLGMRPLDLDDWIQIGDDYDAQMGMKASARTGHPETVLVTIPDAIPACAEVLELVAEHVIERWPSDFARTATELVNHRTGERIPLDGSIHPLDAAGRLVQEDLIVMIPGGPSHEANGDRLVFGAGSVCLPNRWDLRSKLGKTLTDVHAPVSRLNDQLGEPIDRFLERLQPDKAFWRVGWGIIDTPELFQPLHTQPPDADGDSARAAAVAPTADDMHVRVERETLRRLPQTHAVLFTIRTYIAKLSTLLAAAPDDAGRLAEAVAAMPGDVRAYKQLDTFDPALEAAFGAG